VGALVEGGRQLHRVADPALGDCAGCRRVISSRGLPPGDLGLSALLAGASARVSPHRQGKHGDCQSGCQRAATTRTTTRTSQAHAHAGCGLRNPCGPSHNSRAQRRGKVKSNAGRRRADMHTHPGPQVLATQCVRAGGATARRRAARAPSAPRCQVCALLGGPRTRGRRVAARRVRRGRRVPRAGPARAHTRVKTLAAAKNSSQRAAQRRARTGTAARAAGQSPRAATPAAPRAARPRGPGRPGTRGRRTSRPGGTLPGMRPARRSPRPPWRRRPSRGGGPGS